MSYRIAGIDVHKKMIVVVIADVMSEGAEYDFEQRKFGATPTELQILAEWMTQQEVQEAVMESTAQYWKPVWGALERYWTPECKKREGAGPMSGTLHLAQAKSNRGPKGRKNDFADAQRLVKRLAAQELVLSFVPPPEQRLWRTVTRKKYQLTRQVVQVKNQLEAFLEETHIKLSSLISDLLGVSGRRILKALAEGETDPARVANLESGKDFSSWVGVCPGEEETAGESRSSRSPKGNRNLRRLLNQGAQCAVRVKGSIFELTFRRQLPRLGWKAAIWAIAHRLGRLVWKLLHDGVRYIEKGPAVSERSKKARTARMIKELRAIGYHVQPLNPEMGAAR